MGLRDDQLHLPGVPPASMKRTITPKATHKPTKKDIDWLRDFVKNHTVEPGTTPVMNFNQLAKTAAKLQMTAEERAKLLALAEKWEHGY